MYRIIESVDQDGKRQRQRYPATPIMPRSGLYLTSVGTLDACRFAHIFKATWKTIPLSCRRVLLRHWREDHFRNPWWGGPDISLSQLCAEVPDPDHDNIALCRIRGHELWFYAPAIPLMPDDIVEELIAHELAHVFQYAHLRPGEVPDWDDYWEEEAWEIEWLWGFDAYTASSWYHANRDILRRGA